MGSLTIEGGAGGVLLDGRRVVTEFRGWKGSGCEDGRIRVWVQRHTPDPYEWEHHGEQLTAEIEVGRAVWSGPASIENKEPLIFTMEVV